jgi:hypothetical protein
MSFLLQLVSENYAQKYSQNTGFGIVNFQSFPREGPRSSLLHLPTATSLLNNLARSLLLLDYTSLWTELVRIWLPCVQIWHIGYSVYPWLVGSKSIEHQTVKTVVRLSTSHFDRVALTCSAHVYTVNPRYNGHVRFQRFCRYNESAVLTNYRHYDVSQIHAIIF